MIKRVINKLIGYNVYVNIPAIQEYGDRREVVRVRSWLSEDSTVRARVCSRQCTLNSGGTVTGLPSTWDATWSASINPSPSPAK